MVWSVPEHSVKKYAMNPVRLGNRNHCAGEDHQQFNSQMQSLSGASIGGATGSSQIPLLVEAETQFQKN